MKQLLFCFAFLLLNHFVVFTQNPTSTNSTSTVKGINRISLNVNDLSRSVAFYKQAIGVESHQEWAIKKRLKIEKMSGIKHAPRQVALLKAPNGQIELIQFGKVQNTPLPITSGSAISKMPVQGPGFTHICYQSAMSNSIYTKAKTAGAAIVSRGSAPVDRGFGIHYAYIRDADSIMFEVEQFEKPTFTEAVWLGHVAIVTPDIDRLVAFYKQLLGTNPINRVDNIKNSPKLNDIANMDSLQLRGAWFKVGNMLLEMWQFENPITKAATQPPPFTQLGYQKIVFEVDDLNSDYKRLSALGVKFLSAPVVNEEGAAVFLRDCDGNLLSLQQFKAKSLQSIQNFKQLAR
jgi:catechol 2,3-dioxygenase-like lactoylglutathione lyase family enzyme